MLSHTSANRVDSVVLPKREAGPVLQSVAVGRGSSSALMTLSHISHPYCHAADEEEWDQVSHESPVPLSTGSIFFFEQ